MGEFSSVQEDEHVFCSNHDEFDDTYSIKFWLNEIARGKGLPFSITQMQIYTTE